MLYVRDYPNHAKFLSCDYSYAICGSFNWLSNRELTKNEERLELYVSLINMTLLLQLFIHLPSMKK